MVKNSLIRLVDLKADSICHGNSNFWPNAILKLTYGSESNYHSACMDISLNKKLIKTFVTQLAFRANPS